MSNGSPLANTGFRIQGRNENDPSYPDWQEWLEKRLGEPIDGNRNQNARLINIEQSKEKFESKDRFKIKCGGDNFSFVCYGNFLELPLWKRKEWTKHHQ